MVEELHLPGWNWWLILTATIVSFVVVTEIGFRLGRRRKVSRKQGPVTGTVLAALLALLGLLLAFSFSIAERRFETRKHLVVEEANAISTTYLRVHFSLAAVPASPPFCSVGRV